MGIGKRVCTRLGMGMRMGRLILALFAYLITQIFLQKNNYIVKSNNLLDS